MVTPQSICFKETIKAYNVQIFKCKTNQQRNKQARKYANLHLRIPKASKQFIFNIIWLKNVILNLLWGTVLHWQSYACWPVIFSMSQLSLKSASEIIRGYWQCLCHVDESNKILLENRTEFEKEFFNTIGEQSCVKHKIYPLISSLVKMKDWAFQCILEDMYFQIHFQTFE